MSNPLPGMTANSPGRPNSEKTIVMRSNGSPQLPLLGVVLPALPQTPNSKGGVAGFLTSTGAAVNNVTTATPFATGSADGGITFRLNQNSLAGRVLTVSANAAGFFIASPSPLMNNPNTTWIVASTATVPPAAGTWGGIPIQANEVKSLIMAPDEGWLQWISSAGTATLWVWEML